MIKKHLLGGALFVSVLVLLSGCKEIMSNLSNPVSAYLQLSEASTKIYRGQTYQIKYSTISDAKPVFTSTDEKIALVDKNTGVITGANKGTTTIKVELPATENYNAASAEFTVEVDALLNLPATEKEIGIGGTYNIGVTTESDGAITYKSSDEKVATVDATGKVTAVACGDAKITVSIAATPKFDRTESAEFTAKVRIQNLAQLAAAIAASTEVTALLGEGVSITLPDEGIDLSGKKVTIMGDEKKPATLTMGAVTTAGVTVSDNFTLKNVKVQAASMGTKPFILLDKTKAVAKKADGSDSDHKLIEKVELSGVEISGLKDAFLTDNQKTLLENLTIENSIIEVPASNKVTFNFKPNNTAKGYIGKLAISNSTIWAAGNNTNFFVQYGSRPNNVNSALFQEFDVQNSTFVNVANGKNFCDLVQKGTANNVVTLKNNIFVNCGKQNQVVVGFNSGQTSANPVWAVDGNNFCWGGSNVNAAETSKAGKKGDVDIVQNCVAGVPAFKDAANGDFHQTNVKTGDPRWTK